MKRWLAVLPLVGLFALGVLAASQLLAPEKPGFDEADARPAPTNIFPLLNSEGGIQFAPPPGGKAIAVNLFASWCGPCEAEHPLITDLAERHPDQVYGLAYKDREADTLTFLANLGNPYTRIGVDADGQGGLEFGLTGVPETFIIDGSGNIVWHVRGALDTAAVEKIGELLSEN